ncbi:cell growth-regulating nucleolar protein-like [Patiria miniata]|uniref:Zinc finger C2H2 LYAR-type domain-containing protein n=1 Tax=Patiria miniata TaxID=46514 RepID=A0A914B4E7_PATMI|nr:cell growth-regulating nucleolar protein-like [Patiria miniata]XP_038070678.1 cell growth-regulating nucleolar protein-like [Patiria miniata]XP_038070679.1 cell growth-regulating nucleolar protein-like [Patiria miniata]
MVFFTCNSCGQCVKKAHVEKHYLTECRNCEVLSCMDCGKDFVGDDYKHHTKCVSENEKYGGKDYRANAKPNKGEVKQSQWIECVQAASSSQSVSPRVRGLLNRLADYNNIPRKKAKFEKFVQNSLKVWDASLIEQIWTVFSEAGNKQKTQTEQKSTDEAGQRETQGPEKDSELGQQDTRAPESGSQNGESSEAQSDKHCGRDTKKKKKKKRDKHEQQESTEGLIEETSVVHEGGAGGKEDKQEDTDSPKKKKKKKRDKEQQASKEDLNDEVEDVVKSDADRTNTSGAEQEERGPSTKKKKKKHQKDSAEEDEDVTKLRDKERQMETHRELKHEKSNEIRKDKRQHKQKRGHLKDENSKGVSSDAAERDAGLKMDPGQKTRKTGLVHVNGDGEKRKQKRDSVIDGVGDETGGVIDGLLILSGKKKQKRQKAKEETGYMYHKDGLLLVSEKKKKKTKKHEHESPDQNGDDPDVLMTESKVEKSEGGAVHISRKKKKNKSKHTEATTDDNVDAGEKLFDKKKKHKSKNEDVRLEESDPAQQTEKKKKKKRKLNSTSDENGVQLKIQNENGNFEQESPSSKTKKPKKRNQVDSADDFQTPIKKKKRTKFVDENGQTARKKSHTKKKGHP